MERTKEDFFKVMRNKTDDELLQIIEVDARDYTESAREAVVTVLNERGISYTVGSLAPQEPQYDYFAEQYYESKNRFLEYLIDYAIILLLVYVVSIFATIMGLEINISIISLPTIFLYYYLMESKSGKTVGKLLLGLRVVDIDGNQPTNGRIALRTLCRFVPYESVSFLFGGWRKDHTLSGNWHDKWSKTYVVSEKKIKTN